jgi:hypothetical protein
LLVSSNVLWNITGADPEIEVRDGRRNTIEAEGLGATLRPPLGPVQGSSYFFFLDLISFHAYLLRGTFLVINGLK